MTPRNSRLRRKMSQAQHKHDNLLTLATKAVGYIRVSTDEQAQDGFSLGAQREAITAFAKSQGYELVTIIEDAGVSGAKDPITRPGFKQVMDLAAQGAFGILLVWKFDRLARSLSYAVTTAQTLREQYNVTLRSVTEPIETESPMGQMLFSIFASMAAMEREGIKERTLLGKEAKAKQGGYTGGKVPYGYQRDKEGNLIPSPTEAPVVQQIFAWHNEGKGARAIATLLNKQGIPTRSGKHWIWQTVDGILRNPRYQGKVEYYFAQTDSYIYTDAAFEALVPKAKKRRA